MREEQIADFVRDVVAAGCNITAVLGIGYEIGDDELSEEEYDQAAPLLATIEAEYGSRDHLRSQIVAYLTSIGRCYPRPQLH